MDRSVEIGRQTLRWLLQGWGPDQVHRAVKQNYPDITPAERVGSMDYVDSNVERAGRSHVEAQRRRRDLRPVGGQNR